MEHIRSGTKSKPYSCLLQTQLLGNFWKGKSNKKDIAYMSLVCQQLEHDS